MWFAGGSKNLFRSIDAGSNWEQIDLEFGPNDKYLAGLHFQNENKGVVYFTGKKIFKTSDAGNSWLTENVPTAMKNIQTFGLDTVYAHFGNTLMWSYDGGEVWSSHTYDDLPRMDWLHIIDSDMMYVVHRWTHGFYRVMD